MALETATVITELDPNNPPGTDKKKQGDDHIRMLKDVLKNCFPNADKAFYFPNVSAKSADFVVSAAEMHTTFTINTAGGAVVATLPTLTADDDGWFCYFIKTVNNNNPYFVSAPGGLQSGEITVSRARRCIPNRQIRALWTGSQWLVERAIDMPVGSVVDLGRRTSAPFGFAPADGRDVGLAADFPELYIAQSNSTVITDRRGRTAFGRGNLGGVDAGRIAGATGVNQALGLETTTLVQANMPNYGLPVSDAGHNHGVNDGGHFHGGENRSNAVQGVSFGGDFPCLRDQVTGNTGLAGTGITLNASVTGIFVGTGGSSVAISRIPPGLTAELYVVLE